MLTFFNHNVHTADYLTFLEERVSSQTYQSALKLLLVMRV